MTEIMRAATTDATWPAGQARDEVLKSIDEKSLQIRRAEQETSEEVDGERQ